MSDTPDDARGAAAGLPQPPANVAEQATLPGLVTWEAHAGPLPPPEQLRGYELVHPGAAAWILNEAEKNADHVRAMERLAIAGQTRDATLHRVLPFLLVLAFLLASTCIAIWASVVLGGIGFGGTLLSVMLAYFKSLPRPATKAGRSVTR